MSMKAIAAFSIFLSLLALSCSNDPVFESRESRTPDISLVTLESGVLVGSEGDIPISLSYSEEYKKRGASEPLTLEGVLKDPEGEILATVSFGQDRLIDGKYPSITLPPLDPGYYHLTFTLRNDNGVLSEKILTFFYDPGDYSLSRISSYPLSFLPGSSGIFRAYSTYPEEKDPYIRWTMDGRIIGESPVSEGGDKVFWSAPKKEGVYSVKAELFPFAPKPGDRFSFSSSLMLTSQIFVSGTKRLQDTDFTPESAYYTLFHFQGNLTDDGTRQDKKEAADGHLDIIGTPEPDFVGEVFGYALDGDSGFETRQTLLPRKNGRLLPFTLRMLLYPRGVNSDRNLFRVASEDSSFGLALFTDAAEGLVFRVESNGLVLEKYSGLVLTADKASLVELSVSAEEDILSLSWNLNGTAVASSEDFFIFSPVPDSGVSRIAGKSGFVGILDEFGVRMDHEVSAETDSSGSVPAENPETEKILFSLEKGIQDRETESEGPKITFQGKVVFENTTAAVYPGASLTIGPFDLFGGAYELDLQSDLLADSNKGELTIRSMSDTLSASPVLLFLQRDGEDVDLYIEGKKIGTISEKGPQLSIRLLRFSDNVEIVVSDQSAAIPADPSVPVSLSFVLSNLSSAESAVVVRDLVLRREAEDPVKRLLDAFGTGNKN